MVSLLDSVISRLEALNADVAEVGDPRIAKYPLMDSMYPQMILCLLYIIIIYSGMRFMKTRPPLEIRRLVQHADIFIFLTGMYKVERSLISFPPLVL